MRSLWLLLQAWVRPSGNAAETSVQPLRYTLGRTETFMASLGTQRQMWSSPDVPSADCQRIVGDQGPTCDTGNAVHS